MRTIKFRAWDKIDKKMLHGDDGNLFINCWGNIAVWNDETEIAKLYKSGLEQIEKNDVEIMQYTGLKDKNGKEIYEGDIMTKKYGELGRGYIYMCVFHNGAFGYSIESRSVPENFSPFCNSVNWNSFEVIGNIYENPNLLN